MPSLRATGLVALSAALQAACFPPLGLFPLAWLALVPFLAALARVGPLGGFALGLLWSLLVGLFTSSWLPSMISEYFHTSPGAAWGSALLATLGTGVCYGGFGASLSFLARLRPPSRLAVALLWGACEYGRTVAPIANPWMLSGYSQAPFAVIRQLADVGGVVLLGMLLAGTNAALAGAVDPRWRPARPRVVAFATAAVLLLSLGYGAWRLATPFGEGPELRVALVQSAVPRERRFAPAFRAANLAHQTDLVARAGRSRPALILLSELAIDVPLEPSSREARALGRLAERSGADLLVGAPLVPSAFLAPGTFNSFFLLRGRALADRYDKVALAPFSETNPLPGVLDLGVIEYLPGRSRRPLASQAGPLGVLLCSEAMFGSFAREAVRQGAEILVNPANDSWFGSEGAARAQLDVARLRAVETRRWLARPTFTGITAIVDAHGRITAEAAPGMPALLEGTLRRSTASTLYEAQGDLFGRASAAIGALWLIAGSVQRVRASRTENSP